MTTANATLFVRDHETCRFVHVDEWDATTAVASVSSDPRSFRELCLAWRRYREDLLEDLPWRSFSDWSDGEMRKDWILIDMACLCIESNCAENLPAEPGGFQREEGDWTSENPVVWFNFPPTWKLKTLTQPTPVLKPLGVPVEPLDFRGVLFGRAMAADFAKRMKQTAMTASLPSEHVRWADLPRDIDRKDPRREMANRWHELGVRVHAAWLMSPRDDLNGEPPRTFLHAGRDWVEREIFNRQQEWSQLATRPRALQPGTYAYVYGPMGRDEVVIYFDYCREVIAAGWKFLGASATGPDELDRCASAMYEHGRRWLESGEIDGSSTPPAEMIETSRRHMPALADGSHLDCECPICRMMEDEGQLYPMFTGFDGHHLELDGEFAFSLCETRDDWEDQESAYGIVGEADDDEECDDEVQVPDDDSVWQGYVDNESFGTTTLGLAFRVAELVGDLKREDQSRDCIVGLNDAFDTLRKASSALSQRQIAADSMKNELERVAELFPELVGKSSDLQSQLDQWLRETPTDEDLAL